MKTICAYCEGEFDVPEQMADHVMNCEKSPLVKMIKELGAINIKFEAALKSIASYDEESIWMDDRDDAADDMLSIARNALDPNYKHSETL